MNQLLNYSWYSCLRFFLSSFSPFKFSLETLIIFVGVWNTKILFYSRDIGPLNEVSVWRCLSEYLQWLNVLAPFSWAIQCGFNLKLIIINMIYGFALVSKTWSHVSIWISHYNRLYLSRKNDWFGTIFASTPISWMKEGKMWNWVQNQLLWKCRCSYFNRLVAC